MISLFNLIRCLMSFFVQSPRKCVDVWITVPVVSRHREGEGEGGGVEAVAVDSRHDGARILGCPLDPPRSGSSVLLGGRGGYAGDEEDEAEDDGGVHCRRTVQMRLDLCVGHHFFGQLPDTNLCTS